MADRSVAGSPAAISPQSMMADIFPLSTRMLRAWRSPWIQVLSVSILTVRLCCQRILISGVMKLVADSRRCIRWFSDSARVARGTLLNGLCGASGGAG